MLWFGLYLSKWSVKYKVQVRFRFRYGVKTTNSGLALAQAKELGCLLGPALCIYFPQESSSRADC